MQPPKTFFVVFSLLVNLRIFVLLKIFLIVAQPNSYVYTNSGPFV